MLDPGKIIFALAMMLWCFGIIAQLIIRLRRRSIQLSYGPFAVWEKKPYEDIEIYENGAHPVTRYRWELTLDEDFKTAMEEVEAFLAKEGTP